MTGNKLPHPPVPRNSHGRVHWRRGLGRAWDAIRLKRFSRSIIPKSSLQNEESAIHQAYSTFVYNAVGLDLIWAWGFGLRRQDGCPIFEGASTRRCFIYFCPVMFCRFFGFQQTVSHFMFFSLISSIYIYIYLEPKWPLFWLERAFFWRVETPKSFSPSNYFRKRSERETTNLKLENETSEHQS